MPQPSSSLSPKFRRARRVHERGELDEAERLYADILRRHPEHFDALHLLAMLNYQRGRLDAALALLRAALRIDGARADPVGLGAGLARPRPLRGGLGRL
jgi:tetratricopeptide (TPR) repeat protein